MPIGQRVMPKNLTPNKDKTTPTLSVESTMYYRMQKRKWRGKCTFKKASLLNDACRMKMAKKTAIIEKDGCEYTTMCTAIEALLPTVVCAVVYAELLPPCSVTVGRS